MKIIHLPTSLSLCLSLSVGYAMAADQTWIDGNANNDWNTSALNWDGGVVWVNGENAIFGGTAETVTLTEGVTVGNMTFNSDGYIISGNTLSLGATTIDTGANNASIGSVLGGAAGGSLIKEGGGILTLTSTNTYTGGTTVNNGTLAISQGGGSGGIRGALTIGTNGTVQLTTTNALGYFAASKVTTVNINGGLLDNTASGDNGWGQTFNLTGGTMRSNGGAYTATGQYYSVGDGSSFNTLASADSSTISGRLNLRQSNTVFDVADGAADNDLVLSAAVTQNAAGFGITKTGDGTMLVNNYKAYTGNTVIDGGKLALNGNFNNASEIHINSGATLELRNTNQFTRTSSSAAVIIDGGTLTMIAGGPNHNKFGNMTLRNGALWTTEVGTNAWAGENFVIRPNSTITVDGTTSTMSAEDGVALESGNITFAVANDNAGSDLLVNTELENGGGLTKTGAGTMEIQKAATYTGATTVSAGTLALTGGGSISASSVVTVATGGTIDASGTTSGGMTIASGKTLAGEGGITGNVTLASGSILLADADTAGALAVTGDLDSSGGSVSVTLTGTPGGTIDLVSFTGAYTGAAATDFNLTNTVRNPIFSSTAGSNGIVQLTVGGSESKVWDNTTANGQWDVNSSANWTGGSDLLFLDFDDATFTDTGAGTVTLQSNVTAKNVTFSNTAGNDYTLEDLTDGAETLSLTGTLSHTGAGNVTINNLVGSDTAISHTGAGNLTFGSPVDQTLSGDISGTGAIVKAGAATLTLSGDNSAFSGGLTVGAGTVETQSASALGTGTTVNNGLLRINIAGGSITPTVTGTGDLDITSDVTFASGTSIDLDGQGYRSESGSVTIEDGASLTFDGRVRLSRYNGGQRATTTITGGSLTTLGNLTDNRDSWFDVVQSGGVVTAAALRSNQTETGQNQGGTSGNSTYTLTGGELVTGGIFGGNGTAWNRGITLNLGGGKLTATGDYTMTANTVNLTGTNGNVDFNTGAFTVGSNYGFSGAGGLTKTGTGTLAVTRDNTYTGGTIIDEGTLNIGNGGTTGSVAGAITNNSALVVHRTNTITFGNDISGAGTLSLKGNGNSDSQVNLTGDNSAFTGNTTIDGARARIDMSAGDRVGSGSVTVESDGQLWLAGTLSNDVTLNGNGTTEGAGDLGAVRFSDGANLSGAIALGSDSRLTPYSAAETGTVSGIISGAFGIEKTGAGTLILNKQNTFTGGTTVNGGILQIDGGGGASGAIRGALTINDGGRVELNTGDALGYENGTNTVQSININDGGVLHRTGGANETLGSVAITMDGGTISSSAAVQRYDLFGGSSSITVNNAAATPGKESTITATMDLRQANTNVTVNSDAVLRVNQFGQDTAGATLTKAGDGTLILDGASDYTGKTYVTEGTLAIGVSGSIASSEINILTGATIDVSAVTGGFTLENAQTLSGPGSVVGPIQMASGSVISPGASPGTLTFDDNLTVAGGATMIIELDGTGAGLFDVVDGDATNAANTLTIDGGTLDLVLGYTAADGDSFVIFENWTIAGAGFDSIDVTGTALGAGLEFDTTNLYTTGTLDVIVIPEPASALLLALGGMGCLLRRKRA